MLTESGRQVFPDRLRGLALLGIVVVNAPFFSISIDGFTAASTTGALNAVAAFLVVALAQGKFYLIFSFLFGYSCAFMLDDGGKPNRRRFRRRLLALGILGLAHAIFLFIGDILLTYAILGCGLLLLFARSDRVVRGWIWASAASAVAVCFLVLVPLAFLIPGFFVNGSDPTMVALDSALAYGTFWQAAQARLAALPTVLIVLFLLQGLLAFAAFGVGLLASRAQLLADPVRRSDQWRRLAVIGMCVGLPLQVLAALLELSFVAGPEGPMAVVGTAIGFTTAPILAMGYVALLGWALSRRPALLSFAQNPGRASLSVYIGESIILSLLFCGYGLGYFGQWGAFAVVLAAVLTWLVLALVSAWWFRHRQRGPLEWLVDRWTRRS